MSNEHFLIDTSAWIESLRPGGSLKVMERVRALLNEGKIVTTELIILELLRGCREERSYRELKEDMESLTCVSLRGLGWSYAYRIGFELRDKGLTIPVVDLLIAAMTIQADAILVHCDHHFEQVAQHTKLRTENLLSVLKTA